MCAAANFPKTNFSWLCSSHGPATDHLSYNLQSAKWCVLPNFLNVNNILKQFTFYMTQLIMSCNGHDMSDKNCSFLSQSDDVQVAKIVGVMSWIDRLILKLVVSWCYTASPLSPWWMWFHQKALIVMCCVRTLPKSHRENHRTDIEICESFSKSQMSTQNLQKITLRRVFYRTLYKTWICIKLCDTVKKGLITRNCLPDSVWLLSVCDEAIIWLCVRDCMGVWGPWWLKRFLRHRNDLSVWRSSLLGPDICPFGPETANTNCIEPDIYGEMGCTAFSHFYSPGSREWICTGPF